MSIGGYILRENYSDYVLKRIDDYFTNISMESHNMILKNVGYEYCSTPTEFIAKKLNIIKSRESNFKEKKFLDVGSGIGNVCGVAALIGFQAEGIELNPILFNISKQIYPELMFYNIDIRNFNDYQNYDIIFYFIPFFDVKLEEDFKTIVENNIRVGSYIVTLSPEMKDDRFINIDDDEPIYKCIWQKIK